MKIIVVEDEIRIREGISRLLGKMGADYEIIGEAENGEEGLKMLLSLAPDIVITDIRMPVKDGLDMLREAYAQGCVTKAIVLSAYSEFEYARQAMKMGVTEYLLKPVMLNDFSKALHNAREQVEKEKMKQPEEMGTLERIVENLLFGGMELNEEMELYLEKKYGIFPDTSLIQICIYLGSKYQECVEQAKGNVKEALKQEQGCASCVVEASYKKAIVVILYGFDNAHTQERWFQYQILQKKILKNLYAAVGWIQTKGMVRLREDFDILFPYMDWNITLGKEVLISYPKITKIQTAPCVYPVELENQLKTAICINDKEKIKRCMDQFHGYFHQEKIYAPKEIKECYVRFLWTLINIGKEVGSIDYKDLQQQKILEWIMNAKSTDELKEVSGQLLEKMLEEKTDKDEISNIYVKRACGMIQEFYQSGITLDEIAEKLNITPEYLGTQFHREMGVTYSTYIKDFRMNKAKEMLIGTQLKLYEIAEQLGYSDPKYFSRVFKESTGQLPGEYRNTHR